MNLASGDFAAALHGLMAIPRHAQVDEIASLRVYLATPEAAFVTGVDLVFGGGSSA
jgi:3-oxoacyl-[acyl-carrier protein] reductase